MSWPKLILTILLTIGGAYYWFHGQIDQAALLFALEANTVAWHLYNRKKE